MTKVDNITANQVKIMRALLKLNRGVPRKEILENLKMDPTSFQFSLKNMEGFWIDISYKSSKKTGRGNAGTLKLTEAGKIAIHAFDLANK